MAITLNQNGLIAGASDTSRSDGLADGSLISITSSIASTLTLVWKPDEDVSSTLTQIDSTHWTLSPQIGAYGSYMFFDAATSTRRIFAIRSPVAQLRIPALNETGHQDASLINSGPVYVQQSDFNEASPAGPFTAGNYGGWYLALRDLVRAVENMSSSGGGGGGGGGSNDFDRNPSYLTLANTGSLNNERMFLVSTGLKATDNGANSSYVVSINNNIVATVSGTTFTGAITGPSANFTKLTGSLTKTAAGLSAFVAGSRVLITSGTTSDQVTIDTAPFAISSVTTSNVTASVHSVQRVSVLSAPVTISLPSTHLGGDTIIIKLASIANNVCTVSGSSGALIDNQSSITLTTNYEWATLMSDGTNWMQVS